MCGRFSLTMPLEDVKERFEVEIPGDLYEPRYNAAPGQNILLIPQESPNKADFYRWGLVPSWAKDPKIGNKLINARAETVAQKPAFRNSFKRYRCLVPADGFYEWDKKSGTRLPYRFTFKDGRIFSFAGIYDHWKDKNGDELRSFSIITTEANRPISQVHDRMPVILNQDDELHWINPRLELDEAKKLLKPYPEMELEMYQISTMINSPTNDTAEALQRVV